VTIQSKKLSSFCRTGSGGTPSRSNSKFFENGTIPWVKSGELKNRYITSVEEYITELAVEKSSAKLVSKGSLLIAMYGATVGEVSQLTFDATTNQAICNIAPDENVCDVNYLYRFLEASKPYLLSRRVGGGQPNISQGIIKDLEVPLPSLSEQRRIASILDKADELRQKRQQAIEKLDQLLQATFIDMFGDPILNTKNWPSDKKLGDIADIVSGITKGRKITGKSLREIPYLAVSNVQDKYLNLSVIKTIEASDEEIERYKLQQGDLLLTEGGDPDKLGRGTLWNNEVDECIHQNHVFRVRLTSKDFTPNYLNWIVGSEYGKRYFLKSAKQTTGIASINMGQLKKLPLLIPPLDLQIQFDERCNKFHQIKKQLVESYKDINNLFKSLQNQAFSGNL